MTEDTTDGTRRVLAELLGLPAEDVLHYAIVVRGSQATIWHRFCGLPRDGIMLHAQAAQSLAVNLERLELAKLEAGCTGCAPPFLPFGQ